MFLLFNSMLPTKKVSSLKLTERSGKGVGNGQIGVENGQIGIGNGKVEVESFKIGVGNGLVGVSDASSINSAPEDPQIAFAIRVKCKMAFESM